MDNIRKRMTEVRGQLDHDVEDVVDRTRELTNWRYYVEEHPWLCTGAVAVVGFLLVPRKTYMQQADPDDLARLAEKNQLVVTHASRASGGKSAARTAATLIVNALVRAAVSYVGQQVGKASQESGDNNNSDRQPVMPR